MTTVRSFALIFAGLVAIPCIQARTTVDDSEELPTMLGTTTGFFFEGKDQQYTNTQVDLGLFSFSGASSLSNLTSISATLSLNALNSQTPGFDNYGYIDLTVNGIDTGIQVNGFGSATTTATVSGIISSGTASEILTSIGDGGYSYQVAAPGTTIRHGIPETTDSGTFTPNPNVPSDYPVYTTGTTTSGQAVLGLTLTGDSSTVYPNGRNTDSDPSNFQMAGGATDFAITGDEMSAVPEPSTYAFIAGVAALGLALYRRSVLS